MNDTRHKGEIAELKVQLRATEKGYICSKPCMNGCRYDLIIDDGQKLHRVQVKYGGVSTNNSATSRVKLYSSGRNGKNRTYKEDEIDAVVAYLPDVDKIVWLPRNIFETRNNIHIRTRLGRQGKNVMYLDDYVW
jgi:hypothetical protein